MQALTSLMQGSPERTALGTPALGGPARFQMAPFGHWPIKVATVEDRRHPLSY